MEDEEGIDDEDALCAVWEREAEGKSKAWDDLPFARKARVLARHGTEILGAATAAQKAVATGQQQAISPAPAPDVDPEDPPEEFADALEADEFVIYGKASIEKFDDGGQNSDVEEVLDLSPDVVERALDRFFTSEKAPGIISIGHDDIPVGRPLESFELDEDTAIEVGDETFEFEAGETLTTHVEDGDDDGRPELWMLGDLAKDTEVARKVRLAVLTGELDGFSVTFGRRDTEPEGTGRRVTDWDLFSVTLAPDDMVANKGAEFDLAAFKAEYSDLPTATADDATTGTLRSVAEELARGLSTTMSQTDNGTDIDEETLLERLGQKLTGDGSDDESTDDEQNGDNAGQKQPGDDGDAVDELITALAEEMGVDEDALRATIEQAANDDMDGDEDEGDEDEDEDVEQNTEDDDGGDDGDAGVEINFGEKLDEHGVVTEDDLGEKFEEFRETIVDDVGEKLAETNEEAVEEIAQKMAAGETPSPAGGSYQDEEDFRSQLEDVADGEGW